MEPKGFPARESPAPPYPTAEMNAIQNDNYSHPQPPPPYNSGFMPLPQDPQQPQHQPQHQPHVPQTTYIVQQVYSAPLLGPAPSTIMCPSCRQQIVTRLDYETTTKTHIMAGLLCAFVCWPCAWIPYCMDSCKNANHYCPSCGAFIGTHKT